jgi:hypothetical protein
VSQQRLASFNCLSHRLVLLPRAPFIDVKEEIGLASMEQVRLMFLRFYPDEAKVNCFCSLHWC